MGITCHTYYFCFDFIQYNLNSGVTRLSTMTGTTLTIDLFRQTSQHLLDHSQVPQALFTTSGECMAASPSFMKLAGLDVNAGSEFSLNEVTSTLPVQQVLEAFGEADSAGKDIVLPLIKEGNGPVSYSLIVKPARDSSQSMMITVIVPVIDGQAPVPENLVGLHNRDYLDYFLPLEMKRAAREKTDLTLLLVELDHFSEIIETYGPLKGNDILVETGKTIRNCITRPGDFVTFYSEKCMAVVLPGTGKKGGMVIAEDIRETIEEKSMAIHDTGEQVSVTVSLGGTVHPAGAPGNPASLIEKAQSACKSSASAGHNRVTFS